MYRINERVTAIEAVLELVRVCQVALAIFSKLDRRFCDGLLCDETVKALSNWWTDIGLQTYAIEPSDGVLGPTTIAALLGLYLGSRNRLQVCGAPVPKDAFEIISFKHGISYFQRSRGLEPTRRLDHKTLQKLHRVTAKAANSGRWAVPRAVKSTVAELGKGGKMVMGMVRAKDRAGIAEVETPDIDQFAKKISGDTCKWLWKGKARKSLFRNQKATSDEKLEFTLLHRKGHIVESSSSEEAELMTQASTDMAHPASTAYLKASVGLTKGPPAGKATFEKADGHASEAENSINRVSGTTGHGSRNASSNFPQDEQDDEAACEHQELGLPSCGHNELEADIPVGVIPVGVEPATLMRTKLKSEVMTADKRILIDKAKPGSTTLHDDPAQISISSWRRQHVNVITDEIAEPSTSVTRSRFLKRSNSSEQLSIRGHVEGESVRDLADLILSEETRDRVLLSYTSKQSGSQKTIHSTESLKEQASILRADRLLELSSFLVHANASTVQDEVFHIESVSNRIHWLREWIQNSLNTKAKRAEVDELSSEEVVRDVGEVFIEKLHEIDALGSKLEYEIDVLESKIDDVETGIADLDRQVSELELRSVQLNADTQSHNWHDWAAALMYRIGLV